jgi:hypothetical protein
MIMLSSRDQLAVRTDPVPGKTGDWMAAAESAVDRAAMAQAENHAIPCGAGAW